MVGGTRRIDVAAVQAASDRGGVQQLLGVLGYDTSEPVEQTAGSLGVAERFQHLIRSVYRVAAERLAPGLPPALEVYCFETTAQTVELRKALAAAFRNKPANALLVVATRDFDPLDFVLVEKAVQAGGPGGARVAVGHRLISLDRRHPSRVHLRVLERMSRAAADPFAQFERIRDAFRLAEWSEDEFNNRGLFSDYFLKSRLADARAFPVWNTDLRPLHQSLTKILADAGDVRQLTTKDMHAKFVKPTLAALGFKLDSLRKDDEADFLLRPSDGPSDAPAVAALLAYQWDRPLDRQDDLNRDRADHVPGIRVVGALEKHKMPWAILTNGKDWRLYCAAAHSRASNYYEVELPEALGQDDLVALRYFWLFFRAASFMPALPVSGESVAGEPLSFLDQLRLDSQAFAKELGDRLRGRIFDEVFPYLAEGFVQYRRSHFDEKTDAGDEFLGQAYDATLTLLYRLLFLLYAESLDLLPVHEPAYASVSLTRLKQDVAEAAGKDADAVEGRLKSRYTKSDTDLWLRLGELFQVIAEGSREHNVPAYNGGLFCLTAERGDKSREANAARFLKKYRVPDYFLARAVDLLARDDDPKTQELVFVDYRSLGVRQLGTIYEGLLMYHVVVPQDDWERGFRRGNLRIALVPSNQQRKSTGSYFTPQHIVKYIVTNAVGPLLDEKFQASLPRLREAQRWYADKRKSEDAKADKFRSQRPTDDQVAQWMLDRFEKCVWELFDVKVLDPAMGSAHFLVETVDYITDRVLDFLAGFPTNPVQALVDLRIRRQIIASLDQQEVKINEERLTDVNLIKRLVMKRCVYGVDLNPMAVELAKVSLWLDSFTLGAPLSFLDHHLKCGNSLIGATIEDLKKARSEGAQTMMFALPLEPLQRATRNMESIADVADATLTEVSRSAHIYQDVLSGVRGYRALLDCLTAEHFGVPGASELISHGSDLDLDHWDATLKNLDAKDRRWIEQAEKVARERAFFHWDVDFPDVFFTSRRPEQMRRFDAVVGNPPYDILAQKEIGRDIGAERDYFLAMPRYVTAVGHKINLYRLFVARSEGLLRLHGRHSFIVPMALIADRHAANLRRAMLSGSTVSGSPEDARLRFDSIEAFPQKDDPKRRVFEEAKLPTCAYVSVLDTMLQPIRVRTHAAQYISPDSPLAVVDPAQVLSADAENASLFLAEPASEQLARRLATHPRALPAETVTRFKQGELNLTNAADRMTTQATNHRVFRGANIARWNIMQDARQGEALYLKGSLESASKGKLRDVRSTRLVHQECAALDNYRRLIGAVVPPGSLCGHTVNYCATAGIDHWALAALFNSSLWEWRFKISSTNNHVSVYETGKLPVPRFELLQRTAGLVATGESSEADLLTEISNRQVFIQEIVAAFADSKGLVGVERQMFATIDSASQSDQIPDLVHDSLAGLARVCGQLGSEKESLQHGFSESLRSIAAGDLDSWTGASAFRDLDYFGWQGRFPNWQPDERSAEEGRWYPNGVCPPLDGEGSGGIPWELIARVYPSYPLPGIDADGWEAAAWDDLCDLLRKNKTKIGNPRVRADLTGSGRIEHPTGALRQLRDTFLDHHRTVRANRARAAELDFLIDRIVFRLFDLTLDEQQLILSRVGPGRPLPPRRGRKRSQAKKRADRNLRLFDDG